MNQILSTKIKSKKKKLNKLFRIQFIVSFFIVIGLVSTIFYSIFSKQKKEKLANKIIGNYNIYKLYSNNSNHTDSKTNNNLLGIIEIPKINIYYPVFSCLNEELLKISPCKFYGESPSSYGNICIAGHNYNNSMFFGNLNLLNINDEIYIYDNNSNKYIYKVIKTYEVGESDLSPIFDYNKYSKELTLVTCNNLNSKRLIVKAKQN